MSASGRLVVRSARYLLASTRHYWIRSVNLTYTRLGKRRKRSEQSCRKFWPAVFWQYIWRKVMEILGRFNKRLYKVQTLNDLERRWQKIDANSPYPNHSQIRQNKRKNLDSTYDDLGDSQLGSLLDHKRTRTKLAIMAAKSYWRCGKNPDEIILDNGLSAASPIKVTMSYGKSAKCPAVAQKALVMANGV
jgi:hypothetical protein